MKTKLFLLFIASALSTFLAAQTINKSGNSNTPNTVCPGIPTTYSLQNVPSGFSACTRKWVPTNGIVIGSDNGPTVSIQWDDTPGAKARLICQFSNCGNANSGTETSPFEELILSVKNQTWGSYGSSVVVDYCTRAQVNLSMPHMYVQGTGGIGQPPLKEVVYSWTLPAGWRQVGTGNTGNFGTFVNAIAIEPIGCSVAGSVTVKGIINVEPYFCGSAAPSATATINLISSTPTVTITVPQGYAGSRACDTNNVTFSALLNPSLSCVSSYSWTYPSGWTLIGQSANNITLRPSGNSSDAGSVRGTVNFTCGSSATGVANVQFITPVVTGTTLLCTTASYAIQNAAPNPTIAWSTNNANVTIDGAGVATRTNNYNGPASILATVCGTAATPRAIYVGFPAADNTTLVWAGTRGVNPIQTVPGSTYQFNADFVNGASNYTWIIPSGFVQLGPSTTTASPQIYITTSSTDGVYYLYCSANNSCGSQYLASLRIENGNIGGGGGSGCPPGVSPPCKPGPGPLRMPTVEQPTAPLAFSEVQLYPNPVNKNLGISFVQEAGKPVEGNLDSPVDLTVHNSLQQLVFIGTTNKSILDVSVENFPAGLYIATFYYKKQTIKKQFIVNR